MLHILSLGAGVQSTTLYLLDIEGRIDPPFTHVIFADTQSEPAAVYAHLDWLRSLAHVPILVGSAGNLGESVVRGTNARGRTPIGKARWASIPAYTAPSHETRPASYEPLRSAGRVRRQCTADFKVDVFRRVVREQIIGLKKRARFPASLQIVQSLGLSAEEVGRAARVKERFAMSQKWSTPRFPLIEMGWSRRGCEEYLKSRCPHPVQKSACVCCPYTDDWRWLQLKTGSPAEFERACEVDRALRAPGSCASGAENDSLYLHRKCIPLEMVDLADARPPAVQQLTLFDCEGMCGS